jgi:hypothetical protein
MRNYVIKPGYRGMFLINTENEEVDVIDSMSSHIDWVYDVPEDGILKITDGGTKEVKKGDKVIVFYTSPYTKNVAIVVNNAEWNENVEFEKEYNSIPKNNDKGEWSETCCNDLG